MDGEEVTVKDAVEVGVIKESFQKYLKIEVGKAKSFSKGRGGTESITTLVLLKILIDTQPFITVVSSLKISSFG